VRPVTDLGPQGRSRIRELLSDHSLTPRKSLGQHFLTDPNVIRKIVALAGVGPGSRVVEIGGGTGTLTAELAATGASVVVYEIDDGLVAILGKVVGGRPNVEIRHRDAVTADLQEELEGEGWVLVANLPYNVGTGILLDALQGAPRIATFVVMVQTEVADRLLAGPGSKVYGVPSVVVALYSESRPEFTVRPELFYPRPPVDSTVLVLDRIEAPEAAAAAIDLAKAGFQQRRKMVRRSLAKVLDDPESALLAAGLDPTSRAEALAPADFVRLAEATVS
jgi:16S rRNA (adenine1518-N6/adenine1519-N6)-dimethyltransferase